MTDVDMHGHTDADAKAYLETMLPDVSLSSEQSVYADLLTAQTERAREYEGRNARAVLGDMDRIITEAEKAGKE